MRFGLFHRDQCCQENQAISSSLDAAREDTRSMDLMLVLDISLSHEMAKTTPLKRGFPELDPLEFKTRPR